MRFRVGHDVRYEIEVEAVSASEAEALAEAAPYEEWVQRYVSNEDVLALDESPINPEASG